MAFWSRFFSFTAGSAASRGASSVLGPVFGPASQNSAARRPYAVLSPEMAAEAETRNLDEPHEFTSLDGAGNVVQRSSWPASAVDFEDDALRSSVGPARYGLLKRLASQTPQLAQLLDLWRRGRVDEETVDSVLAANAIPRGLRPALKSLRTIVLPYTDTIRLAVREVYSPAQREALDLDADFPPAFLAKAKLLGVSEQDARDLWAGHWDLPSYSQLAEMRFRGLLSQGEFRDALKAADYAPTWRGKLEAIARAIPTMTDFQRLSRREVYNPTQRAELDLDAEFPQAFADKAALHGMSEDDARDLWAGGWRLPSATAGYEMLHRGLIEVPELNKLLKALDYAPTWRGKLRNIAYRLPGRVDLRRMYAEGVIDRPRLKRGYLDLGYNPTDAEILTEFAVQLAEKAGTADRQTWLEKAQSQLWTRTHSSYLAAEITEAEAREKLPKAGVPAGEADAVIEVWNDEREVERKQVTPAQLKKAWQKAVKNPVTGQPYTRDDVRAALIGRGFPSVDAETFLDLP